MNIKKMLSKRLLSFFLAGTLFLGGAGSTFASPALKDDFYGAVNEKWLQQVVLSPQMPMYSVRDDLNKEVQKGIKQIIQTIQKNKSSYAPNSEELKILAMYENCLNVDARKETSVKIIKSYIDSIDNIKAVKELAKILGNEDLILQTLFMPTWGQLSVEGEKRYELVLDPPQLHLYDPLAYGNSEENIKAQKGLEQGIMSTWTRLGLTEEEATLKAKSTLKVEKALAKGIQDNSEPSRKYTLSALKQIVPNVPLEEMLKELKLKDVNEMRVTQMGSLKEINALMTEENLEDIKNYLETGVVLRLARYIVDDTNYNMLKSLPKEELENQATYETSMYLQKLVGKLYGEQYADPESRAFVFQLVKDIKEIHKQNIMNKEWLSEETKAKAIEKLDKMRYKLGTSDKWESYEWMDIKSFEVGGSYMENIIKANAGDYRAAVNNIGKPADPTMWMMMPHVIGAYYDHFQNELVVPAAMFNAPFYDKSQSYEANLAGVGGIVAHEIIHAFDNTGATFDAEGNSVNWWKEEDFARFQKETLKVENFYDKIEAVKGKKINGKLTLGENISDIGGVCCLLQLMEKKGKTDYNAFFENWAHVFGQKMTDEALDEWLVQDPHAPYKYRINAVLQQFEQFYKTYDIKEGDGMYIAPDKRVRVW